MIVFSGSSNKSLAEKIAKKLDCRLGEIELSRFANGEARVFVKEKKTSRTVVVVQSFSNPPDEHLLEFCLICDALKRKGYGKIIGVVPWLGYSKQDKVFREGEPLSVKVIAKILQIAPIEKLITLDLHNPSIVGFFDIPVVNLSARDIFVEYFKNKIKIKDELMVVAPDAGAVKNSTGFAEELKAAVAYIDKERDLQTGEVKIKGISRNVKGKDMLMVDDMVETGETILKCVWYLKEKGAGKVYVAFTHNLFLPGVMEKLLKCGIDKFLFTDSIKAEKEIRSGKPKVLSCSGIIADCVK